MSEDIKRTLEQLQMLSWRLRTDSRYMAWILTTYQIQERISDQKLKELLELSTLSFVRLSLCKRPNGNSPDFWMKVSQIAQYVSIDPVRLANIIRQVESLDELSKMPDSITNEKPAVSFKSGLLAAARDREYQEGGSEKPSQSQETGEEDAAG
jgi:hypothetical protein